MSSDERSSPPASHEASHSLAALATVTLLLSAVWVPARTAVETTA